MRNIEHRLCPYESTSGRGYEPEGRQFESVRAHHELSSYQLFVGRLAIGTVVFKIALCPELCPLNAALAFSIAARVLYSCGCTHRFVIDMSRWPARYASVHGSMNGAQRVRQVWRNVYSGKCSSFASLHALAC